MTTFDTTKTPLSDLLRDIRSGKIQLPDFQRGWVWDDEHIRSLLVSIARSFPVGAVMLLEAGGDAKFKVRPVEGVDPAAVAPERAEELILDGQQRLTSLAQVLALRGAVATRDAKGKTLKRHYYIDIERALEGASYYEEAIIGLDQDRMIRKNFGRDIVLDLSTPQKEYEQFFFPCDQIMNSDAWEEGLNEANPEKFSRYMKFRTVVLNAFRTYHLPVIALKKENRKEAVCLVFEKVNTGGVPLSVFELVTATYAADGVNLRDEWFGNRKEGVTGIGERLKAQKLLDDLQPTEFLQGLTLLHTYERRKEDLAAGKSGKQVAGVSAKRDAVLSLPLAAYQQWKDRLVKGFLGAARFLRGQSFYSRADLPYRTQLVPLAAVLALLDERWLEPMIYDKLSRWFWCGVFGELYGGAVETRLALDLQDLMEWIGGGTGEPSTVQDANFQDTRLWTLRSRNSAAYKGIHVLIQRQGARDFLWKTAIRDLEEPEWEEVGIDVHHIFPRDWCIRQGIAAARYDSILNKTPISSRANRMIGGKAPSLYLRQLQEKENVQLDDAAMDAILRTHSLEPSYLREDDFEGFMEDRQRRLLVLIAEAMGKNVSLSDTMVSAMSSEEEEG